ncbi:DUF423 domain-containing protein, partial [Klebsiella pneumoniae]|uniref:DUF423 domain-containing protein n=1 Tax=Klebsiella pneumoniae TaxID=573 RepID=UPI00298DDADC
DGNVFFFYLVIFFFLFFPFSPFFFINIFLLGTFGAHGLKAHASPEQLAWWQTATDYFFYHALGLLALGILSKVLPHFPVKLSFLLIQIGILFFCGSLYIMAL